MHCPSWDDAFVSSLNSNHTKYLAQFYGQFFGVLEKFRRNFANLVAPPTDGPKKRCKAHPVLEQQEKTASKS